MNSNKSQEPFVPPAGAPRRRKQRSILSANILISYLQRFNVLSAPQHPSARFKWTISLFDEDDFAAIKEADPGMLYICKSDKAPNYLERLPSMFFVVVSDTDEIPAWLRECSARVVLVQSEESADFLAARVKGLFASLLIWENELDEMVLRKETLAALLTETSLMTHCFMCMVDSGYSLLAASDEFAPRDEAHKALLSNGCYADDAASCIGNEMSRKRRERGIETCTVHFPQAPCLVRPLTFDGNLFALLVAEDSGTFSLETLRDLFDIAASRAERLFETFWEDKLRVESPWHRVFTNIISGEEMTQEFVRAQLDKTDIPQAHLFKLICLDMGIESDKTTRFRVTKAAASLNGGKNYMFAYNDSLLVLCYLNSENNAQFSSRSIECDLEKLVFGPFGVRAGVSRIFDRIFDLGRAFEQAALALNFAEVTDRERAFAGASGPNFFYPFDVTLPYYLLASSCRENEIAQFSLRRNVLEYIVREDRKNKTDIARLLWMYLCNNHSATSIAKEMHIHRNTVLYHIDKIEKGYDIKLKSLADRNKLVSDYRYFFLTNGFENPIDFERLLEIPVKDSRNIE